MREADSRKQNVNCAPKYQGTPSSEAVTHISSCSLTPCSIFHVFLDWKLKTWQVPPKVSSPPRDLFNPLPVWSFGPIDLISINQNQIGNVFIAWQGRYHISSDKSRFMSKRFSKVFLRTQKMARLTFLYRLLWK